MIPSIRFDIGKVQKLREEYRSTILFILSELPSINWNSSKQIKSFFEENLKIKLADTTIKTFKELLLSYSEETEEHDLIVGIIEYLKLKYMLKNYLDCIIKHNIDGKVYLRIDNGKLLLPNKRPLPLSPEIQECLSTTEE